MDCQMFTNYIATTEKMDDLLEDDDATFTDMDEEDILEAMTPNEKYSFIITDYKVLT